MLEYYINNQYSVRVRFYFPEYKSLHLTGNTTMSKTNRNAEKIGIENRVMNPINIMHELSRVTLTCLNHRFCTFVLKTRTAYARLVRTTVKLFSLQSETIFITK